MTLGSQFAEQMEQARQMGMDMVMKPMVQEVVNPNLRKITMDVPVVSMQGMPSMEDTQNMKNAQEHAPDGKHADESVSNEDVWHHKRVPYAHVSGLPGMSTGY
jgi:hypothetical protein